MRKILLSLLLLTSCASPSILNPHPFDNSRQTLPWASALRALDPANASTPANDITAVYLLADGTDLQIRVDLLDFQAPHQLSVDIQIGDDSAPEATPLDIHVPSESDSARIALDPLLATVTVTVPISNIPAHPRVDVSTPEDEITGLTLDGPVPVGSAPLLLTFYETFAARLPAEALRSWDGAHTGPRGERHGLKHLLDAVEENQIPIVLLDLKKPESLSALDAMGLLPRIQQMEQAGLLLLPDQSNQEPLFGFPPNPFSWGGIPLRGTLTSRFNFVSISDSKHLYHPIFNKTTFIPIATESDANQPTPDGPSLEVRRALLETALNGDEKDLLVLGGSFPNTTWGSPDMVGPMLAYFASRPYIRVLDAETLRSFPTKSGKPDILPQPETPPDELTLQTQSALEFAKSWAEDPPATPLAQCQSTFPKCVLENDTYLAIFDPQGARLTYLFAVTRIDNSRHELHQLIGPSWQVAPGIDLYPGAFADTDNASLSYEPVLNENILVFTSPDGTRVKTFQLTDNGLKVDYQTQEPVTTQIPLLVDPNSRFTPGWAQEYTQQNTPGGIAWGLQNGPMVSIQFENAALSSPVPERVSKGTISNKGFQ